MPTRGRPVRNYSRWYLVDCEDTGAITVHCRGCLTSPCSPESLAYAAKAPVINVNLCSLQSAVHFHFGADQLYFVHDRKHFPSLLVAGRSESLGWRRPPPGSRAEAGAAPLLGWHRSVLMMHGSVRRILEGEDVFLGHSPEI